MIYLRVAKSSAAFLFSMLAFSTSANETYLRETFNKAAGSNKNTSSTSTQGPFSLRKEFNSNSKPQEKIDHTRTISLAGGPKPPSIAQAFNKELLLKQATTRGNALHKEILAKQRARPATPSPKPKPTSPSGSPRNTPRPRR